MKLLLLDLHQLYNKILRFNIIYFKRHMMTVPWKVAMFYFLFSFFEGSEWIFGILIRNLWRENYATARAVACHFISLSRCSLSFTSRKSQPIASFSDSSLFTTTLVLLFSLFGMIWDSCIHLYSIHFLIHFVSLWSSFHLLRLCTGISIVFADGFLWFSILVHFFLLGVWFL